MIISWLIIILCLRSLSFFQSLSLVCDLCKKDVVIMKLLCRNGEYHEDFLNQCKERGFNKCLYCRCPMQGGGRRNGGGKDYWYLGIQEELGELMSLL